GVGHRDESGAGIGGERLRGRAGAATAAADQADPKHIAARGVDARQHGQRPGGGGGPEELASAGRWKHERSLSRGQRVPLELADEPESSSGRSTHSFLLKGAFTADPAGRNGKSRAQASASSGAP